MLTAFCESCAIAQEDYEIKKRSPQSVVPVVMVAPAMVQMTQPQVTDYLQLWPHSWVHFGTMDEQCRTMGEWSESLMIVLRCREEFKWRQVAKNLRSAPLARGVDQGLRACAHAQLCIPVVGCFQLPERKLHLLTTPPTADGAGATHGLLANDEDSPTTVHLPFRPSAQTPQCDGVESQPFVCKHGTNYSWPACCKSRVGHPTSRSPPHTLTRGCFVALLL